MRVSNVERDSIKNFFHPPPVGGYGRCQLVPVYLEISEIQLKESAQLLPIGPSPCISLVLGTICWETLCRVHAWISFSFSFSSFCLFPLFKGSYLDVSFLIYIGTPATELRILQQQTFKEFLPAHGLHDLCFAPFFRDGVFISHKTTTSI